MTQQNRIDPAAAEKGYRRIKDTLIYTRIVRAFDESAEFLQPHEMCDIADFAIYRGWLAACAKATREATPKPTFEEFLVSYQEKKGLSK